MEPTAQKDAPRLISKPLGGPNATEGQMNPLDAIAFTTPGLQKAEDREGFRAWYTPDGDGVGLYYFGIAPDLPADMDSLTNLRLALSRRASASGSAIVEAHVIMVDGCRAVRQCVKVPQQPSGMTYLGSLTLPFRDFSFVLKIQSEELGVTGVREAVLFNEKLGSGEVHLHPDGGDIAGWMKDPYDATRTSGLARSLADDDEHDERFPDHPLSRARLFLSAAEPSIIVSDTIRAAPPFIYRTQAPRNRSWWKLR